MDYLSVSLSVSLSVCLSVCLYVPFLPVSVSTCLLVGLGSCALAYVSLDLRLSYSTCNSTYVHLSRPARPLLPFFCASMVCLLTCLLVCEPVHGSMYNYARWFFSLCLVERLHMNAAR